VENGVIVHTGEHRDVHPQERLVLLPFFDGGLKALQIVHLAEPLHPLGLQVPVGHGVAYDALPAPLQEEPRYAACG
jgi:hypothetical protein